MTTAPRTDLRFIIIGAGMSGILSAIKLKEAGFDDVAAWLAIDRGDHADAAGIVLLGRIINPRVL